MRVARRDSCKDGRRLTLRSSSSWRLGEEEARTTRLSFKNLKMGRSSACLSTGEGRVDEGMVGECGGSRMAVV